MEIEFCFPVRLNYALKQNEIVDGLIFAAWACLNYFSLQDYSCLLFKRSIRLANQD